MKKLLIITVLLSIFANAQNKLELPKDCKHKVSNSGKYLTVLGKKEKIITVYSTENFSLVKEYKFKKKINYKLTEFDQLVVLMNSNKLIVYDLNSLEKKTELLFKTPVTFLHISDRADLIYLVPEKLHQPFPLSVASLGIKMGDFPTAIYNSYIFDDDYTSKNKNRFYLVENYNIVKEFDSLSGVKDVVNKLELVGYTSKFFKNNSLYIMAYSLPKSDRFNLGTYSSIDESDEIRKYYLLKIDLKFNLTNYNTLELPINYNKDLLAGSSSSIYNYSVKKQQKESKPFYFYSFNEDGFSVISRNHEGYIDGKYPKIQNTKIFEFAYDSSLISTFNIVQDNSNNNFEFVDMNSNSDDFGSYYMKRKYNYNSTYNGLSIKWIPNEKSLGHFDKIDNDIYYYTVLKGVEDDYGVKVVLSKYSGGQKVWCKDLILTSSDYNFNIGGHNTNVNLIDRGDNITLRLRNKDEFYLQLFFLDKETGNIKRTYSFGELLTKQDKKDYGYLADKGIFNEIIEIIDLKEEQRVLDYIKNSPEGNSYDVISKNKNLYLIEATKKGKESIIKM